MLKKMRKIRKKVVSLAIMVAMIVTLLPTTVFAAGEADAVKLWITCGDTDYKITEADWEEIVEQYETTIKVSANHRSNPIKCEDRTGVLVEDIVEYLGIDTSKMNGTDMVYFCNSTGFSRYHTVDDVFNNTRYAYTYSHYNATLSDKYVFIDDGNATESPMMILTEDAYNDSGDLTDNEGCLMVSMLYCGEFTRMFCVEGLFSDPANPHVAIKLPTYASDAGTGNGTTGDSTDGTDDDTTDVVDSNYASGAGTKEDPFMIATAEQLKYFASQVNSGNTYEGKYLKLAADIDLNNENWTPIGGGTILSDGTAEYKFMGSFDGNGKTVSNLKIDADANFQGLFGYNGGTISNLCVNGSITITGAHDYVGGIAAFNAGKIKNTISDVVITASSCYAVGGIAGINVGNEGKWNGASGNQTITNAVGIITECGNTADLRLNMKSGGVVGKNYGTIAYCYNTGDIVISGVGSMLRVGGITGCLGDTGSEFGYGTVFSCYNMGDITWVGSSPRGYGGIAGFASASSSIVNCYTTGDIQNGYNDDRPIIPRYDNKNMMVNNYSLDTILADDTYYAQDSTNPTSWGYTRTADWMKSADFIAELGDAYKLDTRGINGGFVVLKWQTKAVELTEEYISAIGEVGLDSKAAIDVAREAYDGLNANQKTFVINYATLIEAEATYEALVVQAEKDAIDQAAADGVIAMIDALGTVSLDSKTSIDAARLAFNALTAEQRALVTNYDKLVASENAYVSLKLSTDQAAADLVEGVICEIGTVSLDSKGAIAKARVAYNSLTEDQKALVDNYKVLIDAEKAYATLLDDQKTSPKTGDEVSILPICTAFILAVGVVAVSLARRKRVIY